MTRKIDVISLREHGRERLLRYVALQTPVLITDLASQWPALATWTPEHLSERY